jgi:hypothetical protein
MAHLVAVKRILIFVEGTLNLGLRITKSPSMLISGFSNVSWVKSLDDRRSTNGIASFVGLNLVSSSAQKQPMISRSSTQAACKVVANATTEIMWLQILLKELGIPHPSVACL